MGHKEIGGYFELETYGTPPFHENAVRLNSARNALRYIIRAYGIKVMNVPFYTCPVVWDAIKSENCEISFYDIDNGFMPCRDFRDDEYILVNNYFGICDENIKKLSGTYKNLIVDNAQSFYFAPHGLASFYSPRKFFGLPDGGLLCCEKQINDDFGMDLSFNRMSHLLERHDAGAVAGYNNFKTNDASLDGQPIKAMSALTQALMSNISYEESRRIRNVNYCFIKNELADINELEISKDVNAPMVYPLLYGGDGLRERLIENRIYVAKYWDGIEKIAPHDSRAVYLRDNLLPIPIDQRYTTEDMKRINDVIKKEGK